MSEELTTENPIEKTTAKPTASVIIPVYNGADTITQLTERLLKVLPELFSAYEILLIDDCSPDSSWQVVKELQAANPEVVRGMHLDRWEDAENLIRRVHDEYSTFDYTLCKYIHKWLADDTINAPNSGQPINQLIIAMNYAGCSISED